LKRKRTVQLRNLRSLRVRYGLRSLLLEVVSSRLHFLSDQKNALQCLEGFWDLNDKDYSSLNYEYQTLTKEASDLNYSLKKSIIFCPVCGQIDRNMIYNIVFNQWLCYNCYSTGHILDRKLYP